MTDFPVRPLGDRVAVQRITEEKTAGGIALPDSAVSKDRGRVLAVGPGKMTEKGLVPTTLKVGDIVLCPPNMGPEFKTKDGVKFHLFGEPGFLGVEKG